MEIKQKIADEVNKFQELRDQCKKIMLQHKKMEVKLSELKVVKEELDLLEDSARTYKLTGPALMKVELKDAKNTVNERIKYISDEIKRHSKTIDSLYEKQEKHRDAVIKLEEMAKIQQSTSK